jgi:hypothetical protein
MNTDTQHMTPEQIRQTGIQLLTKHLGVTGMVRFFQQTELGHGDYTKERQQWLGQSDLETVAEELQQWQQDRPIQQT